MSAVLQVRTVRKLDGLPEKKEVAGYVIVKDVPLPRHARGRYSPLLDAILALEPGESLVADSDAKEQRYKARQRIGKHASYCVEEIEEGKDKGKWRIWRIK